MNRQFQNLRLGACHAMGSPLAWLNRFVVGPHNPNLPHDRRAIESAANTLRADPKPLARPVVVFSGYRVPGIFGGQLAVNLARLTSGRFDDFRLFAYPWDGDIEPLVDRLSWVIGKELGVVPSGNETIEIDAVGISMGGIVGRLAAARARERPRGCPRVNIRNLFTIATPHRGARLALKIHIDRAARDMQPGSPFLARLDALAASDDCRLVPYATLNDVTVGAGNCSPPGTNPIWIRGTKRFAHTTISMHPAIAIDIARRLRGEAPFGVPSPVPC